MDASEVLVDGRGRDDEEDDVRRLQRVLTEAAEFSKEGEVKSRNSQKNLKSWFDDYYSLFGSLV